LFRAARGGGGVKHIDLHKLGFAFSFAVDQIIAFRIDSGRERTMHQYGPVMRWFTGQSETLVDAGRAPEVVVWLRGRDAPFRLTCSEGDHAARLKDAAALYGAIKGVVGGWTAMPPKDDGERAP
jgi:hypothetical protein